MNTSSTSGLDNRIHIITYHPANARRTRRSFLDSVAVVVDGTNCSFSSPLLPSSSSCLPQRVIASFLKREISRILLKRDRQFSEKIQDPTRRRPRASSNHDRRWDFVVVDLDLEFLQFRLEGQFFRVVGVQILRGRDILILRWNSTNLGLRSHRWRDFGGFLKVVCFRKLFVVMV